MAAVAARRAASALLVLVACATLAGAQPPAASPPASPATPPSAAPAALARPLPAAAVGAIEKVIRAEIAKRGIPGLSVSIATGATLRWSGAYGLADIENEVPARPDTAYRLASLSKPMTAVAALQLVERGQLKLDELVGPLVPEFPAKPWPITVRQLLAHQSGIRHYSPGEFASTRHYGSLTDALGIFAGDPLSYEPGTRFLYSTWAYTLLGVVIERASLAGYLDFVRQNVFIPAGMTATRDDNVFAIIPRRAQGYTKPEGGELRNSGPADTSPKIPGGGLSGTAEDVARFGAALQSGALLSRATYALMTSEQRTASGKRSGSGLGVFLATRQGTREIWHTGGQQRVSTVLYLRPRGQTTVAILSNLEGVQKPLLDLARQVADAVER